MFYVYVLQSERDNGFYVEFTKNLIKRTKLHEEGKVKSTKNRRPLKLIYSEECVDKRHYIEKNT